MNPVIPSEPSSSSFILILLFFVLVNLPQSFSVDWYSNCSSEFTCGDISGVGYPFWGDNRGNGCGYPELGLKCENNVSRIVLGNVTYRTLEFIEEYQVLRIARDDYFKGICSGKFANITLDSGLFELSSFGYQNCTLAYGCQAQPPPDYGYAYPSYPINGSGYAYPSYPSNGFNFTCSIPNADSDNGYIIPEVKFPPSCFASEIVPVSQLALSGFGTDFSSVDSLLQKGFEVKLKLDTQPCLQCTQSGGVCGYDPLLNKTVCYCANQSSVSTTCPSSQSAPAPQPQERTAMASPADKDSPTKGKKNSSSLGIGLGIGGAGILVVFLGLFIFAFVKRRRTASQVNTRDIPSTPSSKQLLISQTGQSRSTPSYGSLNSDLERGGNTYFGVKMFTYHELEEATDCFDPSKELGDGGFGTVYRGVLRNGSVVAVKRLYQNNLKRVDQFINEIEILTRLQHQNLVKLYGYTSTQSRELLLVYEYISNGTVADHLFGKQASSNLLPWRLRLKIAIETAEALAYLHRSDIIHRDVKSNNILLEHNFCVKVADFGLSRLFPSDVTHVSTAPQGTPGYVDPEYYQCYKLTDKSDVYSFGVVLCELISTKPAVDTSRHRHDINLASMAINRIQSHALHELVDPALGFETDYAIRRMMTLVAELAFSCLQEERDMRPTMEEVLGSLKGIGNEEISEEKVEVMEEVMDALRGFGDEKVRSKKPEVMDFRSEDVGLLRNMPPPLSSDSVASV